MRFLRIGARLVGLGSSTALIYIFWVTGKTMLFASEHHRLRLRHLVLNRWARTVASLISMRINVHGRLPEAPFFLVANHLSYIDIILLASQLNCVFVAKSDIADWPFIGRLAKSVGTIFIDRTNYHDIPRVIRLIEGALAEGAGIVLFPEGTSTRGDQVLPFSPSLLEPAARMRLPVDYGIITYATPPDELPAHLSICWWGEMTFVPHSLSLLGLKQFEASVEFGGSPIAEENRKVLAHKLRTAVADRFVPIVEMERECIAKEH
jgi:1-acyl-sn-glycerol-3-phosphate acyltransferase